MCGLPECESAIEAAIRTRLTCPQAQRMEVLEKSQGWKEPDFDTVLQYLRTVLLRRKPLRVHTLHRAMQTNTLQMALLSFTPPRTHPLNFHLSSTQHSASPPCSSATLSNTTSSTATRSPSSPTGTHGARSVSSAAPSNQRLSPRAGRTISNSLMALSHQPSKPFSKARTRTQKTRMRTVQRQQLIYQRLCKMTAPSLATKTGVATLPPVASRLSTTP